MSNLKIETGINRNGDCVIVLSPAMYDMLISECEQIRTELMQKARAEKEKDPHQTLMEATTKIPAILTLSYHPKYADVVKGN